MHWRTYLEQFRYETLHIPGKGKCWCDTFSRWQRAGTEANGGVSGFFCCAKSPFMHVRIPTTSGRRRAPSIVLDCSRWRQWDRRASESCRPFGLGSRTRKVCPVFPSGRDRLYGFPTKPSVVGEADGVCPRGCPQPSRHGGNTACATTLLFGGFHEGGST